MPIIKQQMILVHEASGKPVEVGEQVKDFRGDVDTIEGGDAPHRPGSTGRVYTNGGSFYPSVFDLRWVSYTPEQKG